MTNQNLNSYAIGVAVTGEGQLVKLGNTIEKVGVKVDKLNKKMSSKTATAGTTRSANQTISSNKKVAKSSITRSKQVTAAQQAEINSIDRTNTRMRMQSQRFEGYNRKIQHSARLSKNEITDMFRRVALWSTGIGILFGTLSKIKFIFGAVKDLEVQMAELKKVMDDDTPFRTAQNALFKTALSMSVSVDKAAEIAKIWAQQGYELRDVAILTKTALLGVNAANLTAAQSVEFLTSAIKSFKIEALETAGVIDSIMAIQADFAITSANLARGMQVAGAITAQLGGSMNELFGMMTAIGEVTRETGNVIGNSLKTQLARMQQPRTIAYLEKLGIATQTLTDEGAIKRLSAYDIFKQIAEKRITGKLTQDQVLDISLKIGGIRKFKDALILIENFDTAMESMQTGFLAYEDAADASAIIQDTLVRKLDKLNTAFVELGATISESGTLGVLKNIVSGMTKMMEGLSAIAKGESFLGGAGAAAFQLLPLAIIGGFAKFLGRRIFQNIRGTELRSVQELANMGTGPLARTQAQSMYTFFGKRAVDPKFAKAWGQEIKNISVEAKKAGINFTSAHKQLAMMSVMSKKAGVGIGGLNNEVKGMGRRVTLAGRAFRAQFAPWSVPGGLRGGAQVSGGLATARIFGALGGLMKGLALSGGILLAIGGVIKLFEYLNTLKPRTIKFDSVIDPASEASKAFVALAGSLNESKIAADKLGLSLEDYVSGLSFTEKILDIQPKAEEIGRQLSYSMLDGLKEAVPKFQAETFKAFMLEKGFPEDEIPDLLPLKQLYDNATEFLEKGAIKNKADLKRAMLKLDISELILPDQESTRAIQKAFRDWLKFEVAGDYQKAVKETKISLGLFLDSFRELLEENEKVVVRMQKIGTGKFLPTGRSGAWREETVRKEVIAASGVMGNIFKWLSKSMVKHSKVINEAFVKAKETFDPESIAKTFDIKDTEDIGAAWNKVFDKWKKVAEEAPDLPSLDEMIGPYLDLRLGTFSRGAKARSAALAEVGAEEAKEIENLRALNNLRTVLRARIQASLGVIKHQDQALFRFYRALEQSIPNKIVPLGRAALDATFALVKIPDKIFEATSKFIADMRKINVKSALSGILGIADKSPQDILNTFRAYATNTASISASVAQNRRNQQNIMERIEELLGSSDEVLSGILQRVKTGELTASLAYGELEDLKDKPEFAKQKGLIKGVDEAKRVISKMISLDRQQILLEPKLTSAIISWENIVEEFNRLLGVDISGEVELKKIFDDIAKTGNTKEFEKAFGELYLRLLKRATEALTLTGMEKLGIKFQQQASKLTSYANRFFKTGVDIADAQLRATVETQQRLQSLNIRAGTIKKQLADPKLKEGADETLLSQLKLIDAEKKSIIEMDSLTLSMELMAIEADKIIDATDTARQAFTQLFADVSKLDPTTNAPALAFEDAFNQIANVRLENISEQFTNQLLQGFESLTGKQFGEFLLGEELQDPIKLNTDALSKNTMSIDELRFAIAQMLGLPAGGVTGIERFGSFEDIMGGETFSEKARQIEKGLEQLSEIFDEGGDKIEFSIDDILSGAGQILGGIFGGKAAAGAGKETNLVNIGTAMGGAAGQELLPFLGSFAGPIGSILGGILGGLFGSDREIQEEQNENLHRISDNTAELVALDRRIINAPASFTLPAGAQGGSLQWSGNIIVQGGNTNEETARVVADVINRQFRGTTNYNTVAGA
jgi:TP901 family phage tail tape measure protein